MARIKILDDLLASKIAAGEVVERPASVVKELMENSLDAGAGSISVQIVEGGKRLIRITDDGEGITREDAPLAFVRHATSKIASEEDLDAIRTMGFRGEALASIASVARVTLKTRRREDLSGTLVTIEGSTVPEVTECGCPEGTTIEVRDLFYSTPARLKFLRSDETEFAKAAEVFKRIALSHPDKRFRLTHNQGKPLETTPGNLRQRIADLFGTDISKGLIEVDSPLVRGFVSSPDSSGPASKSVNLFVNGRPVTDKGVNRALIDGYGRMLDSGRYPFAVLDITIDPSEVDVNIHPAKSEVRFKNLRLIYDSVKYAVRVALSKGEFAAPVQTPFYRDDAATRGVGASEERPSYSGLGYAEAPGSPRPQGEMAFEKTEGAKNPELLNLTVIGQLWGEFLLAEGYGGRGEFFLIDQHAAAERAAFEALKKEYYGGRAVKSQMLLLPERFETTGEEAASIEAAMPELTRLGFEIADFGPSGRLDGRTFFIKSVPHILSGSTARLIKDLSTDAALSGGSSRVEERIEAALMTVACHSVIRGPRTLTRDEAGSLLKSLSRIDFAARCPHGRPVIKRIKREEIEAFFGR